MSIGAFCLVLHGHLPWVLHHGRWPHGEDWLYEAAAETWLPLLEALHACQAEGIKAGWTVGLMPILLEQLNHDRFKEGFVRYLNENVERAQQDRRDFESWGDGHLAHLAGRYEETFKKQLQMFEDMGRSIPNAFVGMSLEGQVDILSSNATHGYHPLILHDQCARAQVRAGLAASERHLGWKPHGVWLPECAYRPAGPWVPPAVHGDVRHRAGVAQIMDGEDVRFFFVDNHLLSGSRSEAILDGEWVHKVGWDQAEWDTGHAWRSPYEPHRVQEGGWATGVTVLGRCHAVSEQVWSGDVGYPGDGRYLEFHKRHGMRGLKYWKISGRNVDLGSKERYYPDDISSAVFSHAQHFAHTVKGVLQEHHDRTGRFGVVCAPFDAELFGHWWAEGPQFLLEVARAFHHEEAVDAMPVDTYLNRVPADKLVALPEGTWGAGGDHRVWLHDGLRFYWDIEYKAEDRFLDLWHRAPWRTDEKVREYLTEAARQLLLLQASDWPFVITTQGAIDYGMRRILEHGAAFDDLCNGVEDLIAGREIDVVVQHTMSRSRLVDPVFPDLDLEFWA